MISRKFQQSRIAPRLGPCLLAALLVVLSACASTPQRPPADGAGAQAARETVLAAQPNWFFSGRIAISTGGQAGNARIDWSQQGEDFDIRLAAPVGGQSWRLRRLGGQAVLEGLEGGPRRGPNAEALLLDATGWRIPVSAMAAWVRGRGQGEGASFEFAPDGLPAQLNEAGWTVEYRDWNQAEPPLPTRVFARQATASVRLVVERWNRR